MSFNRRVVITGMGLLTPLGDGVEANWEGVLNGRTGIGRHERDSRPEYLQFYGKVNGHERPEGISSSMSGQVRFLNRGSILGFESARQAVESSGIDLSDVPKERRSLFIASGDFTKVGYEFMRPAIRDARKDPAKGTDFRVLNKSTMDKVNPFFLLESISNNLFSFLSAAFQFMGPNTSIGSLSPCGAQALELACRKVHGGQADVALAVGCGCWISEIPMYEMEGLGILSKCRRAEASFRPLDRSRDGFIPGEGGAAIFVEDAEHAERRGARVLGEVIAASNCIELPGGKGLSVPDEVSKNAMKSALDEAGIDAGDLGFICPHGSGTRKGDRSELHSISDVLGADGKKVPVCALKPYTGHMAAASDICEIILGIKAIDDRVVPATLNFTRTEAEFEDMSISGSIQKAPGDSFLSVSYGIIGEASCFVVRGCGR